MKENDVTMQRTSLCVQIVKNAFTQDAKEQTAKRKTSNFK